MKRIILLLFFSLQFLGAQKTVKKTVPNSSIAAVEIDVNNCFETTMTTSKTEELTVFATIEGEYKKDVILNVKQDGSNVLVSAGFSPNFENPNDKLSAHKVVSIALEIIVPEYQRVQVHGGSCNVFATGIYERLKITLNDGSCTLKNAGKKVLVRTQSGNINVESKSAEIMASSKFGTVQKNTIPAGDNSFILTSISGNIGLAKKD